jgi:hypothetical protein
MILHLFFLSFCFVSGSLFLCFLYSLFVFVLFVCLFICLCVFFYLELLKPHVVS